MSELQQGALRPNVLLIHCHDLGKWLPAYDRLSVDAPNLDRFARESIVFDAAFSTSPLCTPARSSLFTGLSPHQNGLMGLTHQGWTYAPGVVTLPEHLGALGYRTALLGLQHEDLDARKLGYDEVHGLGFLPRALEVARLCERWLPTDAEAQPFFAVAGMWEAHRPWPDEDYEPADTSQVEVPAYLPDNEHTRKDLAGFYAAIAQLDVAVGRILDALDKCGRSEDTLVIFTTDHGAAFPRAKGTLYDSGVGVALMIRPPRSWQVKGARYGSLTSHLDIVPTLIELAGGDAGTLGLDGVSQLSVILGEARSVESDDAGRHLYLEKTYHDGYDPLRAVRTTQYKYIRSYREGSDGAPLALDLELSATRKGLPENYRETRLPEELYDLIADPDELHNVVEDPRYSEVARQLSSALDQWMRDTSDPLLEGPIPEPRPPIRSHTV